MNTYFFFTFPLEVALSALFLMKFRVDLHLCLHMGSFGGSSQESKSLARQVTVAPISSALSYRDQHKTSSILSARKGHQGCGEILLGNQKNIPKPYQLLLVSKYFIPLSKKKYYQCTNQCNICQYTNFQTLRQSFVIQNHYQIYG